jgi:hypothetical protein
MLRRSVHDLRRLGPNWTQCTTTTTRTDGLVFRCVRSSDHDDEQHEYAAMTNHALARDDISAAILAAAAHESQGVLGVHFWETYMIRNIGEALEAADRVEASLDRNQLVVTEAANLDKLNAVVSSARQIMKLRKAGVPARDTRWKIAWRDLEDQLDG